MERLKTGVYGLDALIDGGLNEFSNTVVIGPSGAGKTTIATHFIRRGLEDGNDGIFISLDENKDQIILEAKEMGWSDIEDYIDAGSLVFIDASGKKFKRFVESELADFVATWEGSGTRIVIDPLTPVVWTIPEKYKQRGVLTTMFKLFRRVGTVMATLEEHGSAGNLMGPEVVIPMYLADVVLYLAYRPFDNPPRRDIQVIKARNTGHYPGPVSYSIIKGMGVVVDKGGMTEPPRVDRDTYIRKVNSIIKKKKIPNAIAKKIHRVVNQMDEKGMAQIAPEMVVQIILEG